MSQQAGRKPSVIYKVYQYLVSHPVLFYSVFSIATLIICFRVYLRGNAFPVFFDVGSDTSAQYVPYMNLMGMSFGNGSFWNDEIGLGLDMLNLQPWTMDVFNLPTEILFSLGMKEAAFYSITLMLIVRCYLCGMFALFFLNLASPTESTSSSISISGSTIVAIAKPSLCMFSERFYLSVGTAFLFLDSMCVFDADILPD